MKESSERYTNPFLPDEENDKIKIANLENGKFQKFLEPSNVCSESIKAKEVYMDKNVTCYEENGFHIKDICVDEGLSHGEIIKCDKEHHELPCSPIIVNGDKHDDMSKDDLDTKLISSPLEDKIKLFVEDNIGPDNALQNGEEKLDLSSDLVDDSVRVLEPADNGVDDPAQQLSEDAGSEANGPKQTDTAIYIPNETKTEKNTTLNPDILKPTTASGPDELLLNTESAPNPHETASNNLAAAVARGGGESSFSMAGPVSGLITYSGPIIANGNISHRSDGSNSSVRSFAFPILPNEWNSSPIRMAKADPKHSRKHRGWKQAFICCGF